MVTYSVFADLLEAGASVDVFNAVEQSSAAVTPSRLLQTCHRHLIPDFETWGIAS